MTLDKIFLKLMFLDHLNLGYLRYKLSTVSNDSKERYLMIDRILIAKFQIFLCLEKFYIYDNFNIHTKPQ